MTCVVNIDFRHRNIGRHHPSPRCVCMDPATMPLVRAERDLRAVILKTLVAADHALETNAAL